MATVAFAAVTAALLAAWMAAQGKGLESLNKESKRPISCLLVRLSARSVVSECSI
jgi:hypothetical protein